MLNGSPETSILIYHTTVGSFGFFLEIPIIITQHIKIGISGKSIYLTNIDHSQHFHASIQYIQTDRKKKIIYILYIPTINYLTELLHIQLQTAFTSRARLLPLQRNDI